MLIDAFSKFPQKRPLLAAKLVVRSEKQLTDCGRQGDGPVALEPDEETPKLIVGKHYQVLLMARSRCRCVMQVN
jgi:hypothetical protein